MFTTLTVLTLLLAADPNPKEFTKWEKEIGKIEEQLKANPPAKGGVFFAGSSTMRLWNLEKSFPDQGYVNVGFGGSEVRDSTHFAERILIAYEPKTIVFYAGDNDINSKRTAEQVRDDFAAFAKLIRTKLPKTRIVYLPIKPSIARWKLYDEQKKANGYVKKMAEEDKLLTYVDLVPVTLGADGRPKPEYFVKDGLHLSDAGYAAWVVLVKKALE
jgi:lysophospholipase L1-like esterase